MTATLAAELRRMWSRRLLKVLAAVVVLTCLVSATIAFFNTNRDVAEARGRAQQERQAILDACERGEFEVPQREGESLEEACSRAIPLSFADPRFHYSDVRDVLLGTSPLVAILCLVLGASFIGADWQKGTVTTTLTWEPRRVRLMAAKFAAVGIVAIAFAIFAQVVLAGSLWPVAAIRGSIANLDAAWWREAAGLVARAAAVGGLVAIVGCAIATIGRHTTAALGIAFVYFAVIEGLIRGFRPNWQPWLLGDSAAQFISNTSTGPAMEDKTMSDVALTLVLYAALFIVVASGLFKRRDVT